MSLIDETYFANNPVLIPNLDSNNGISSSSSNVAKLVNCIGRNEPKFLTKVLGADLYAEYISAPTNAKWTTLKAKLVDSTLKVSPIANYVYCQYIAENWSKYSGVGTVKNKTDNQTETPAWHNQLLAWNEMVFLNNILLTWFDENRVDFEQLNTIDTTDWEKITTLKNWFDATTA